MKVTTGGLERQQRQRKLGGGVVTTENFALLVEFPVVRLFVSILVTAGSSSRYLKPVESCSSGAVHSYVLSQDLLSSPTTVSTVWR